jgi:hypothetical protein
LEFPYDSRFPSDRDFPPHHKQEPDPKMTWYSLAKITTWPLLIWATWSMTISQATLGAQPPGIVVAHQRSAHRQYIGSPSIARVGPNSLVASHDFFGPGSSFSVSTIHRSDDNGESWSQIATIEDAFWSKLFVHRGALYLLGTTREYGQGVIRRSVDGGFHWTDPVDRKQGLLLGEGEYHCAPMPVIEHQGRLWRAMEDRNPPKDWGKNFRAFVMSAAVDADLLDADQWTISNRVAYNPDWGGTAWLEGNIVRDPQGKLWNLLRNHRTGPEKGCRLAISEDGRSIDFQPDNGFVDLPGGSKKFSILWDEIGQTYLALANPCAPEFAARRPDQTRNALGLLSSPDLVHWELRTILLYHPDVAVAGFQYPDWLIEGDQLLVLSRTAFPDPLGGPPNPHDANYLTFHRVENFRQRTLADPPLGGHPTHPWMPDSEKQKSSGPK